MAAAKPRYTIQIPFERVDPQTGETTRFEAGDSYDGPDVDKYLAWPDGALITEVSAADNRSAE